MPAARRWWTWDQGPDAGPHLYRVEVTAWEGSTALDRFVDQTGLRAVEMDGEGDAALWMKLNGARHFLRGANTIPTQWLAEADRGLHDRDMALARQAGFNALRVHAHVNQPALYDAADAAGILLLQDFTLQWEYSICRHSRANGDPALTSNVDVVVRMLREMMYLLHNHPSVGLWILHNEPLYAFLAEFTEDGFGTPNAPEACPDTPFTQEDPQLLLLDATLNSELDRVHLRPTAEGVDTSRPIHTASGEGDSHHYDGWYGGLWSGLLERRPRLITEYGAEAAPFRGERFMAEEPRLTPPGWPPRTQEERHIYRLHDAQLQNYGMYIGRAHVSYALYADWAFASQRYQAALLKRGGEHFRSLRWAPTGGAIFFTFQNWWDSFTWGIIDADRTPNIAHRWLGAAFAPVAFFATSTSDLYNRDEAIPFELWVVNDVHRPRHLRLTAELWEEEDSFVVRGDPEAWTDFGEVGVDPPTFGVPVESIVVTRGHGRGVRQVAGSRQEREVEVPADGAVHWTVEVDPGFERTGTVSYTWRLRAVDADTGELVTENWHHYAVADDVTLFRDATAPGVHPLPRFSLDVTVAGAEAAELSLTRLYADERVFSGTAAGATHLAGLLPGKYLLEATAGGVTRQETILLTEDAERTLRFPGAATPAPTPTAGATPAPPAATPTPASGGCGCETGGAFAPGLLVLAARRRRRLSARSPGS